MSERKLRPCLRCDRPHMSTPEWRICYRCKHGKQDTASDRYPNYEMAIRGITLNQSNQSLFNLAKRTRHND